jgi:hypothetical protein
MSAIPSSYVLEPQSVVTTLFSYLDDEDAAKTAVACKETPSFVRYSFIPLPARYPLHFVKTVEAADRLFSQFGCNQSDLQIPINEYELPYSPALSAFKHTNASIAEYFVSRGGVFEIEKHIDWGNRDFHFQYPALFLRIREAHWKSATSLEGQREVLEKTLIETCTYGNYAGLVWVLAKCKTNHALIPSVESLFEACKEAVKGGFEINVRGLFKSYTLTSVFTQDQKSELIDLCIQMGYPDIAPLLGECSAEQQQQLKALSEALSEKYSIPSLKPINQRHHEMHGGDRNQEIFSREYRHAVLYALHCIERETTYTTIAPQVCDFVRLIENLGHRRRRMAVLGNLPVLIPFGKPQTEGRPFTSFNEPAYQKYYHRVVQLYGSGSHELLTSYTIGDQQIALTKISIRGLTPLLSRDRLGVGSGWSHPIGQDRALLLRETARLCLESIKIRYISGDDPEAVQDFASKLAPITWLMSHTAPFTRGTPTVISILTDALWLSQSFSIPARKEGLDLNCEALCHTNVEAFVNFMSSHYKI